MRLTTVILLLCASAPAAGLRAASPTATPTFTLTQGPTATLTPTPPMGGGYSNLSINKAAVPNVSQSGNFGGPVDYVLSWAHAPVIAYSGATAIQVTDSFPANFTYTSITAQWGPTPVANYAGGVLTLSWAGFGGSLDNVSGTVVVHGTAGLASLGSVYYNTAQIWADATASGDIQVSTSPVPYYYATATPTMSFTPTASPSATRTPTSGPSTPSPTPTSTPFSYALIFNGENSGSFALTTFPWGDTVTALVDNAGSSQLPMPLSLTAGGSDLAGGSPGNSACISGTLANTGSPYGYLDFPLNSGGAPRDLSGAHAVSFSFKASVLAPVYVNLVTSGVTDYGWYRWQFTPVDTAWHRYTAFFPGLGTPAFAQPGWAATVPWGNEIHQVSNIEFNVLPNVGSTTPYGFCVDDLTVDGYGFNTPTATPSRTPAAASPTPTPSWTPGGPGGGDPVIELFEDPSHLSHYGSTWAGITTPGGSLVLYDEAGCPYLPGNHCLRMAGTCHGGVGDYSYAELGLPYLDWSAVSAVDQQLGFRAYSAVPVTITVELEGLAGLCRAQVYLDGTGWQNCSVATPLFAQPGALPQLQMVSGTWGGCMGSCTAIRLGCRSAAAGPDITFDIRIDDMEWRALPTGPSPSRIGDRFGCSLDDYFEADSYGLDDLGKWTLLVIRKHCGCHPHDIMLLRETMSWGEVCAHYGLSWTQVQQELKDLCDANGLVPDPGSMEQILRTLRNGPADTSPLPTPTPYTAPNSLPTPAPGTPC